MSLKVLVADDSPTIRRRAAATLGDAGFEATCVEDGEAAWDELEAGRVPDLVLCDILMPKLDGYQLCQKLKEDARFSNVPVLLLRGTFEPWDQARAEGSGADGFVTKPFDPAALISTINELLEGESSAPAESAAPADRTGPTGETAPLGGTSPLGEPPAETVEEEEEDEAQTMLLQAGVPELPPDEAPFEAAPEPAPEPVAPPAPEPVAPPAPEPVPAIPPAPASADPFGADDGPFSFDAEPAAPAPPAAAPSAAARAAAAPVAGVPMSLDDAALDQLAERVAAKLLGNELEKIAWEVVPDVAEALIRRRLLEIENKLSGG